MSARMVLLGDSHLARVRRDLTRLGPVVVNAAVGGAGVADVLPQARGVAVGPDDVAVLSVGTNDAGWRAVPLDAFVASLSRVLAAIEPERWVYLVPPLGGSHASAAVALVRQAGGAIVDAPLLLESLGGAAFTEDGIHLTGPAYDVLLPALASASSTGPGGA